MIRWLRALFGWQYEFNSRGWEYQRNLVDGRRRVRRVENGDPRDVDVQWLRAGKGEARVDRQSLTRWTFERQMEAFDA